MKKNLLSMGLLIVFCSLGLMLSGCSGKFTGGGWIETCAEPENGFSATFSTDEPGCVELDGGKITFGFQFKCEEVECDQLLGSNDMPYLEGSGQLQWNDHVQGIKFHGVADEVPGCGVIYGDSGEAWVQGTYTPQPKKIGEGGTFDLKVYDLGEPGPDAGDYIEIELDGGFHGGYEAEGYLGGGNIQVHKPKK